MMGRILRNLVLLWLLGSVHVVWAASASPLVIGVLPFLDQKALHQQFEPLRVYLSQELKRPVQLASTGDFRQFVENTRQDKYDIVVTAPHLAMLAENDAGYQRLVTSKDDLHAVFLVSKRSSIKTIADLKGRALNLPSNLAIVSLLAENQLAQAGLRTGKDVRVHYLNSHQDAILAASRNPDEAAAVGPKILQVMPQSVRDGMRVLALTPSTPNLVLMASKRLGGAELSATMKALLGFHQSALSKNFFVEEEHLPFRPVSDDQMQALEPFVPMTRARLAN